MADAPHSRQSPRPRIRRPLLGALVLGAVALVLSACAITDPATSLSTTAATLNGQVHPVSRPASWWFEYGKTTSYGSTTATESLAAGPTLVPVSKRVSGLTPDTTYHFRLCRRIETDLRCGEDRTFRTASEDLPAGFQEEVAFSGLTDPTTMRFADDGRVFVAERSGLIKVFDGLGDTSATVFADLRTKVHGYWDRGLLGLELHPKFPAKPFVYVAYTHDAAIGGTAPRWGGATSDDGCPTPPGPTEDGCVVSGRVSRLTADGNVMSGPEQVLVEDWCQQFPSHSVGSLAFGRDGSLYVSGGDGASFIYVDYGQSGIPKNPCGDPPGDVGSTLSPPSAEGGALRSQDLRTSGDPAGLSGSVIRIDPETGEGAAGNPGAASADRNVKRIVAHGMRNPFRFAVRPGTDELWLGDVGSTDVEEINRLVSPVTAPVPNFGWPCYEGGGRQGGYDGANLSLCESFYASGSQTAPYASYRHSDQLVAGENCPVGSSSISGMAFAPASGGTFPSTYDGALFFADAARGCIWAMKRNGGVLPSPAAVSNLVERAATPVDLQFGPTGDLFYVDFAGGTIRRIIYRDGNRPPLAVAQASRTSGALPLTVNFDGSNSDDPDSSSGVSYAWDLDGDGSHDDSTSATPSYTYTVAGTYTVELKVTDSAGASATDAVVITAGNTPPTAAIAAPGPAETWKVGDTIRFSGAGGDEQDGSLPASRLSWSLVQQHCPSNCHSHPVQTWTGVASGSLVAPDHEYPSYLELRLTVTDSGGLSDTQTVRIDPRTVDLTLRSSPTGLDLTLNALRAAAPFTRSVIQGSTNSIGAPSGQLLNGSSMLFKSWSDGGAATHSIKPTSDGTYTATFGP